MSFTDQKPHIATEYAVKKWGGDGVRFRCYFCGIKFNEGDQLRFLFGKRDFTLPDGTEHGTPNFIMCKECDTEDNEEMQDKWLDVNEEFYSVKFWALRSED